MSEKIRKMMKKHFDETGVITVTGIEKPSRTWGYTLQGVYNGHKFTSMGGCGYCKRTGLLEEALRIIGYPRSLGSYDSKKVGAIDISLDYDGKQEIEWALTKGEKL